MSKQKLRPLGQRVLLQEIAWEQLEGDILLPGNADLERNAKLAKVLAVGTPLEHVDVKKGDHVLLSRTASTMKINVDGCDYKIANLKDLLGIVPQ